MAKKVLSALASGLLILLVLVLALTMILGNIAFFGPAIAWLLAACLGILILFVLYLTVSWVLDAIRRHGQDEENLDEENIEQILTGSNEAPAPLLKNAPKFRKNKKKKASKKSSEAEPIVTAMDLAGAQRAADEAARKKEQDEQEAKKKAVTEAKIQKIAEAETAARERAAVTMTEEERALALAEADALRRAYIEAQKKFAEEEAARLHAILQEEHPESIEQEQAAKRKAAAIETARKQAEAAATARRRAAQVSARTQSFAVITPDMLPSFNTSILEKVTDAAPEQPKTPPSRRPAASTDSYRQEEHPPRAENLWEKMQVRQSAAPVLSGKANQASHTTGWTYSPAKLPDAWRTETTGKRIPGDMSFTGTLLKSETTAAAGTTQKPASERRSASKRPTLPPIATDDLSSMTFASTTAVIKTAETADGARRSSSSPAKPKPEGEGDLYKRPRGRPPKPKTEDEAEEPKRQRGRPPKPKTEEIAEEPKRPRGRPRKEPTAEDLEKFSHLDLDL